MYLSPGPCGMQLLEVVAQNICKRASWGSHPWRLRNSSLDTQIASTMALVHIHLITELAEVCMGPSLRHTLRGTGRAGRRARSSRCFLPFPLPLTNPALLVSYGYPHLLRTQARDSDLRSQSGLLDTTSLANFRSHLGVPASGSGLSCTGNMWLRMPHRTHYQTS